MFQSGLVLVRRKRAILHLDLIVLDTQLDPLSQVLVEGRHIVLEIVCRYNQRRRRSLRIRFCVFNRLHRLVFT